MKVIGITGGIGSGKSTATKYLVEKGYTVLDADKIAREIVEKGSPTLDKLANEFGKQIIKNGELDRKMLASVAFADKEKRKKLNKITHSEIKRVMLERIEVAKGKGEKLLFIDAALLFEAKVDEMTHENWLIYTPEETRIKRVMERDNSLEDEVRKVMSHQMPETDKKEKSDIIIENVGTVEELYNEIDKVI